MIQTRTMSTVGSSAPDHFQDLKTLHQMAMAGAPLTREDRLARQVIDNALSPGPEIYNFLVFGDVDAPVAIMRPAPPPHSH